MLGRLGMTVDECINAYVGLSERVFRRNRRGITFTFQTQGKFDSGELENAIREIIRDSGSEEEALLEEIEDRKCRVQVQKTLDLN
jgi:hypothetical protein